MTGLSEQEEKNSALMMTVYALTSILMYLDVSSILRTECKVTNRQAEKSMSILQHINMPTSLL